VSLYAGETLRLRYTSAARAHNVFMVTSETAFDTCALDDALEVAGGADGLTAMDVPLNFPTPGTFFYVCARMCTPLTDWCHCSAYMHKLRVHVLEATTSSPTVLPTPAPTPEPSFTSPSPSPTPLAPAVASMVSTSSAPAPVVAVELALDLAAFETTVGVSLTGDLTGLLSTEADAVRAFATDAAADVETALRASGESGGSVTCLYRLEDPSRLNLLTLADVCVAPRRLRAEDDAEVSDVEEDAAQPPANAYLTRHATWALGAPSALTWTGPAARRMNTPPAAAAGIGAIISLDTPAAGEIALESVEISSGGTSVQADANVVIVSEGSAFASSPSAPSEVEVKNSNALVAVAAGGLLYQLF
jgi:hypothetical protein